MLVRVGVLRAIAIVTALGAGGCVNNYVVRDGEDEAADDEGGSSTTCEKDTCGQGDGAAEGDPFVCMPCESDLECGDDWDNCVALDEIGSHCLFACPETGCPAGYNCRITRSVDQVEAMQCTPHVSMCEPAGGD